jgi:methionyl-tRNA formyltransferase
LGDDTAAEVMRKVCVAAELTLTRALPALRDGSAQLRPQQLADGAYFGRRTRADGAIDWRAGAKAVHNLVRAVAPPFPGAFALAGGVPLRILRTLPADGPRAAQPELRWVDGEVRALCADGALRLLEFELDGQRCDAAAFRARYGTTAVPLGSGRP